MSTETSSRPDPTRLRETAVRVRHWLNQEAWPLWIERGIDSDGLFYEQLDFAGHPDLSARRRVRVQGRQLFCFAQALAAGHEAARDKLALGLATVEARCWGPDGKPGWIHMLTPDGQTLDTLRDTYDQAFMLFGLAAAYRVGFEHARVLAERTIAFLDRDVADGKAGGYLEGVPASLPRRSNPHMHLMEAMLVWYSATGDKGWLARAEAIAALFETRFFDRTAGTLGEYFSQDLRLADGDAGDSVEPGHHFEWSWLLHRLCDLGGRNFRHQADALYRFALRHGIGADGFAVDECRKSGEQQRASRRTWPQTELIKAHLANGAWDEAATVTNAVLRTYLGTQVAGLWIDQFDARGEARADVVPASTLYHLVVAFEDLLRIADEE
ncbi:AGE family epimerase/isomerase [Lichenicoccus roseus]|uniref:N-acylglucosamine 2-epimerase n=1 Tax=Lichenicoccus roseus TaxID=2683649 RepID=A0A5R9J9R0_9PROT|nr:AGE family epimerase/isomerase [Lichenicoccus roseus]TLU72096.1 N-acylglucosamine 2-epimerase [Lichenicoccus roseus]